MQKEQGAVKVVASILLALLSCSVLCAQSEPSKPDAPNVEVLKSSWSKIRIGWERDPFGGPLENFDEMRSRARNERRVAQGGGDRAKREAKADEANIALQREKAPALPLIYKAKLKTTNGAPGNFDWDHVFLTRD
jgi:hypothetical protein